MDAPQRDIDALIALQNQGQQDEAFRQGKLLLNLYPKSIALCDIMGVASASLGRMDDAIAFFERGIAIKPDHHHAHNNLGVMLSMLGRKDAAILAFDRALRINPDYAEALYNRGAALQELDRRDDAIACYERALELKPDYAEACNNLGNTLRALGREDEALDSYQRALAIWPDYAEVHNNLGIIHQAAHRDDAAVASFERAIACRPDYADAHNNLGKTLQEMHRIEEAIACYDRAVKLSPDHALAYNNLGTALRDLGHVEQALGCLRESIDLKPDFAEACINLGNMLKDIDRIEQAILCYQRALVIDPANAEARAQKLHQQAHLCDWDGIALDQDHIPSLGIEGGQVSPFTMLALEDRPDRHRQRSEHYAAAKFGAIQPMPIPRPVVRSKRLRVGYFSADFHDHATMRLAVRLFEAHDKARFSVNIYSYGPDNDDPMRARLLDAADIFHDVRSMSDRDVAELARRHGLDIAVDLKGYTHDGRTGIFAYRAAPIQIAYLGYPCTLGAPFIDYMVVDRIVIPPEARSHYTENLIYLPGSYQVNDDSRLMSDRRLTRAGMGLPDRGFVFCCFNNSYKITPDEFDIWMRLLSQVDGSVLWLLASNAGAEANLRGEAERRGIAPERLVFAGRVEQADHLARHKLADLFLDTFNVNAHTTASDALWVGLPVVTRIGHGFAARVAASLLNAVGMPELVTATTQDYEALALTLATAPARLKTVKEKLVRNRLTAPLFDAALFTANLEAAYRVAHDIFLAERPPRDIMIE